MRSLCGGGVARADPAGTVQNRCNDRYDQGKKIEVTEVGNVIRAQETFAGGPVRHHGDDLIGPGERDQDKHRKHHQHRIAQKSLDRIRNDQRQCPAHADDRNSERQHDKHHNHECRDLQAEKSKRMRQVKEIDEETGGDSRADHIGEHLGKRAQSRCENTERAVIAHLQKLPQRHRLGFTETVDAVSGQGQDKGKRQDDIIPECHCESGLVMHLDERHKRNDRKSVRNIRDADHITSANTACGQKVRHTSHIRP